jgi:hypothetical protein
VALVNFDPSYRKGPTAVDQMTPRAWRVPSSTGSHPGINLWYRHWYAIARMTVASTTMLPVLSFAQPAWTGQIPSEFLLLDLQWVKNWASKRVKAKLRNGEYIIPGDQWPIFLWKNSEYNPDDPWNGFLRSKLLISVSRRLTKKCFMILFSAAGIQVRVHIAKLCGAGAEGDTLW